MSKEDNKQEDILSKYNAMKEKYVSMANNRDDFNGIDPNKFLLPDMNEMVQEDLMSEIYQQYVKENTDDNYTEKDIIDSYFYKEAPFTTSPGHYTQEGAFVLKANKANLDKNGSTWDLNKFDGDTWSFALGDIDDGGEPVMFTNNTNSVKYKNFKDYYKKMGGGEAIQVRALGIDAMEIPHYEIQVAKEEDIKRNGLIVTFKEMKDMMTSKVKIIYEKCPRNDKGEYYTRKDDEQVYLWKVSEENGVTQYTEVIKRLNPEKYISYENRKAGYKYFVVLGKDESSPNSIQDGYDAQNASKELLEKASEIILVLNANGIKADINNTSSKSFNSIYYLKDIVKYMIKEWDTYYGDLPITNYSYIPYGMDNYKRCLGVVYVKYNGEWINLNKYVLCKTKQTIANPKFDSSPELQAIGSGISDSFNLWSYDRNNIEWLDSYNKIASKSYQDRLKLHKDLTGIDFTKVRNCALFIGDTLMLIPPESIKNVTQVSYERIPNMRSKGTQAKQKGQNEQRLEISLYFYEDVGINGIPYTYTTPNGTTFEYKIDGLRSLLAQFKVAPFLPIENGYINDVLGIEAVALENMSIQTVEGFPRLLRVILTLKEFNYRVFMPDMPIDEDTGKNIEDEDKLAEMPPMFAKSFNWEIFRYYYQRAIIAGDELSLLEFASYEYNLQYYTHKNAIGPWWFQCGPKLNKGTVSFYIPDESWLANALQVKKERDEKMLTPTASINLSDEAKKFVKSLNELAVNVDKIQKYESEDMNKAIDNLIGRAVRGEHRLGVFVPPFLGETPKKRTDILDKWSSLTLYTKKEEGSWDIPMANIDPSILKYIKPMQDAITSNVSDPNIMKEVVTNEVLWKDANGIVHLVLEFCIKLNLENISNEDWSNVKELAGKPVKLNPKEMFIDDSFTIGYEMTFTDKWDLATNLRLNPLNISDDVNSKHFENTFMLRKNKEMEGLNQLINDINKEDTPLDQTHTDTNSNKYDKEIDFYVRDYKNPANMPYVPYVQNILCKNMSANMANTFTEISLKAIEGEGPQYMGGQDTQLELELITDDTTIVTALNTLPTMASAMAKTYRKVLPAWPIKIKSDLTTMLGVSEVLIDMIEVSTVEGFPGIYSIVMRLTSVDRTQRQREALRRLDVKPEGGDVDSHTSSNLSLKNYFNINNALSKVELYPDLDLPSLEELGKLGFRYVKYSGQNRSYPDPDFYIVYAYPYTSLLIKKMVKDVLSKNLLKEGAQDPAHFFKFRDVMGAELTGKIENYTGISIDSLDNDKAKTYFDIINSLEENIAKTLSSHPELSEDDKKQIEDRVEIATAVKKLVLADINDGWEIRPGWRAPLADKLVDDAIRKITKDKKDAFAEEIKERRTKCIKLIDTILSKPIQYRDTDQSKNSIGGYKDPDYKIICEDIIQEMFTKDEGLELIKLLCPSVDIGKKVGTGFSNSFGKSYFKDTNPLHYLVGFLFASGCALSGNKEYASKVDEKDWYPNQYLSVSEYPKTDTTENSEFHGYYLPYCTYNRLAGSSKYATSIQDGIENGNVFGAWRIVQYSDPTIINKMTEKISDIKYIDEKDSPYKEKINAGFLDPYYNSKDRTEEELKKYKKTLLISTHSNAEAFVRNTLLALRKLIVDGLLISEIDILAEDWDVLYKQLNTNWQSDETQQGANPYLFYGTTPSPMVNPERVKQLSTKEEDKQVSNVLEELGFDQKEMNSIMNSIKEAAKRSFCARLVYPFIVATTKTSTDLYDLLDRRNYDGLNSLTGYIETSGGLEDSKILSLKFLSSMSGMNMSLQKEGKNESKASEGQKLINSLLKDIYIKASDDPRAYILHSFYDMLVNDKRGRLTRAFPTYYVVFVDEGRKYGSWKLHDNFYNMNSISSINVVKSRKIAADTCTLVMNNTFNSYTMEPDSTTTQQYADIYGLRDVFDSIFSPKAYFDKEKRIRLRKNLPDTVLLQPGVRIHVRMGYSADGSKLPIVFNGKVAEVEINEVAQIIAQGDGHELTNPLSAFGEIDAVSLDAAQSTVTWFKDLRGNWSKGGESPRDLLAKVLTAKYGGWRKVVDDVSDGRWFNDNPFGIMHFGDPKFRNIFEQGEIIQNLYEVSDSNLIKGVNTFSNEKVLEKVTPILNVSMQDKTFWDLLHLSANAGINYVGAVRDFGFRSTIFLGKPNHYYAYEYTLVDNKVIEKRKPFQQFHYYDSYTDIVYNSIKASEAQMKTNAVGMWQCSSAFWGREQATVGPIYLDMNIYPEYQRTMTVDTGLLATGNGGIDVPAFNHLSESWNLDPNDDKVNKSTAWRVTANALKDSVKDMYLGDVGVIGDPSVKPHDRVYIHDTYEDMMGMFEVEAVIHNMSAETGFTTSIMPDVIARHEDKSEAANQSLLSNVGALLGLGIGTAIIDKLWGAAIHGKLVRTVARSKKMYGTSKRLANLAKDFHNASGLKEFLEGKPTAKMLFENLNALPSMKELGLEKIDDAINFLSKVNIKDLKDTDKLSEALYHFSRIDMNEYEKALRTAYKEDKFGFANSKISPEELEDAIKEMKAAKKELDKAIDIKKLNITDFVEEIYKVSDGKLSLIDKVDSSTKKIIEGWKAGGKVEDAGKITKELAHVLQDAEIKKAIKDEKLVTNHIDDFLKSFSKMFELVAEDGKELSKFASLTKKLKGNKILSLLKNAAKGVLRFNWATLLIDVAVETTLFIFTKNAQEVFTRFLQGIQAVDVYPLKKNNKPLIAGMNGHKGSVHGWPIKDGYDSIQGMVKEFTDSIKQMDGNLPVMDWVLEQFVDKGVLDSLSEEWRQDLLEDGGEQTQEEMLQDVYNNISSTYSANNQEAYAMMIKPRIKTPEEDDYSPDVLNRYKIVGKTVMALPNDPRILRLNTLIKDPNIKEAVLSGKFVIAHNQKSNGVINIPFESGSQAVAFKEEKGIIDLPLVQDELIWLLNNLLKEKSLKDKEIHFKSGVRVNDEKGTWRSTGFSMVLEIKGFNSGSTLKAALDKYIEESNIIKDRDGVFSYKQDDNDGNKFNIMALAPIKEEKQE